MPEISIDLSSLYGYKKAMEEGYPVLLRNLAKAFGKIGKYDIDTLRASLPGKLNIRAKGLAKSFKFKSTDLSRATDFSKLFLSEYTGWKAAQIFQTGGTISGKGKYLTVLLGLGKTAGGKRLITQKQLVQLINSGQVKFIPTPRGILIVQELATTTKSGRQSKKQLRLSNLNKTIVLGILKKSVKETKRLDFYENSTKNDGMHTDFMESAIEDTLVQIANPK